VSHVLNRASTVGRREAAVAAGLLHQIENLAAAEDGQPKSMPRKHRAMACNQA